MKLDFEEWVSLIFLLFDESYQCSEGFRNIQDISSQKFEVRYIRHKKTIMYLLNFF